MLQHLLAFESEPLSQAAFDFVPVEEASPPQIINGKGNAQVFLESMGVQDAPSPDPAFERALAHQAFGSLSGATPAASQEHVKNNVMSLRTPEAVRKTVQMLTAYEWEFVEQARNIRGYIVSGLLDETKNPKAEIRLKAYKLLGDVTEVALFTQRTEVVTKNLSDAQIEEEINKRLEKLTINVDTPLLERVDSDVDDE